MYNTKVALLMVVIKILDEENVHYSLPTMKSRDDSPGGSRFTGMRGAGPARCEFA